MPNHTATSRRLACSSCDSADQASRKRGAPVAGITTEAARGSCFHRASMLSATVTTAEPCSTWISRNSLNRDSSRPKISALVRMPTSSMTQSSVTTSGRDRGGAMSVASASPTVCTVCSPAPTSRKASEAAT